MKSKISLILISIIAVFITGLNGEEKNNIKWLNDKHFELIRVFSEGMAPVRIDGKWGYIDKTGNTVINPQFEEANAFHEDLAAVKQNGKWGYIDKTGNIAIKPIFDVAYEFTEGLARAGYGEWKKGDFNGR